MGQGPGARMPTAILGECPGASTGPTLKGSDCQLGQAPSSPTGPTRLLQPQTLAEQAHECQMELTCWSKGRNC